LRREISQFPVIFFCILAQSLSNKTSQNGRNELVKLNND
jgi:hypothetical protein